MGGPPTLQFIADVITDHETEIRIIPVRLDYENWQWHCSAEIAAADFPIPAPEEGKRYLLYSDGTFGEVEK